MKKKYIISLLTSIFCTTEGNWDPLFMFLLQHHPEVLYRTEIPVCLVLLRGPWSHNCRDERWEVSAEPAWANLTEVTSAHHSQHDQFSWGKDTLLKAWQREVITDRTNGLIPSKEAIGQNQSNQTGSESSDRTEYRFLSETKQKPYFAADCTLHGASALSGAGHLPRVAALGSDRSGVLHIRPWGPSGSYPEHTTDRSACFGG